MTTIERRCFRCTAVMTCEHFSLQAHLQLRCKPNREYFEQEGWLCDRCFNIIGLEFGLDVSLAKQDQN